eukprot:COSAG01_NODE_46627_length_398_cov_1.043478_1_plen_54_part_10
MLPVVEHCHTLKYHVYEAGARGYAPHDSASKHANLVDPRVLMFGGAYARALCST